MAGVVQFKVFMIINTLEFFNAKFLPQRNMAYVVQLQFFLIIDTKEVINAKLKLFFIVGIADVFLFFLPKLFILPIEYVYSTQTSNKCIDTGPTRATMIYFTNIEVCELVFLWILIVISSVFK